MSYCPNPDCRHQQNPTGTTFCQNCGSRLLLQNRYRPLKLIGQGGFGRTFLAVDEDELSKPYCVIKQFFPQAQGIANTQKAAELFEQEAVRLEMLGKHPQIPQFLAHFEQDNRQYLVQEFIDGQNLAQELQAEGAFNGRRIRDLLNSLLPVIEFIHAQNVIHRDIKPENIICRGDGQLVLVDFGAAKYATGTALVRTGTVIGSAGYAAPEQAGGKAAFSSDLYSLGVTCLHLLTQAEPFDLYSFSEATWVWQDYLTAPISRRLRQVLDKMVKMATSQRYQSASEVLHALNSPPNLRTRTPRFTTKSAVQSPQAASPRVTPTSTLPMSNWRCVYSLERHAGSIRSLAISPDGQLLVSGSDDKTIKLWHLVTGEELFTFKGHTKAVYSVAISSDGEILASGSDDKTIKIWQLKTGHQLGTITLGNWFSGDSGCVYSVAISPNREILASLSSGGTIKLWNLNTGREIRTLKARNSWVQAVAISPDGQIVAGGSDDSTILLWSLRTGKLLHTFKGHSSWIQSVAFSPNGQILASGGEDATIKLWDLRIRRELCTLKGHTQSVYALAFSPVPSMRGVGGDRTKTPLQELAFSKGDRKAEATLLGDQFQRNQGSGFGQMLASSSNDRTIRLWDLSTGQEFCALRGHPSWIHAVAFTPDGQTLASGCGDSIINIWRCERQSRL